jgi:Ca2+-binding RTX toxin-like protein
MSTTTTTQNTQKTGAAAAVAVVANKITGTENAETLAGTAGSDEIFAYGRDDSVTAGDGNDTLWGGWGNDSLFGGAGDDLLAGESGDDLVDGGEGSDTYRILGNTTNNFYGYDTYKDSGTSGTDRVVVVGPGAVDIGVRGWNNTGIEEIDASGTTGTVRLLDTGDANVIDLRATRVIGTNVVIDAGYGNDTIFGSATADTIVAGGGNDVLDGGGGGDTYRITGNEAGGWGSFQNFDSYADTGTSGVDRIVASGLGNVDIGFAGSFVGTTSGIEEIDGTGAKGTVRLYGDGNASLLDFRSVKLIGTNMVIDGNYGDDTIYGSAAADTIVGAGGNDVLNGGEGGDTYRVTGNEPGGWGSFQGFDTYADTGTTGTDRIVALGTGAVDIGLLGNFGAASGIEQIDGTGAKGTVRLYGDGNGTLLDFRTVKLVGTNLVIDASGGNDMVYGSAEANTIVGGSGDDTLDGAGGADTYRVTGSIPSAFQGYDTYLDSGTGGPDKIAAIGTGDVDIGLKGDFGPASGIETIDASGAKGTVRLLGDGNAQTLDFRQVTLVGTRLLIDAGNGNDVVYGSAGADTFVSNSGEDTLDGGAGADVYRVTGNGVAGFHGYDTYKDSGASTSGSDKIAAIGAGDVDIGLRGGFGATSGIEVIDGTGAAGVVRLLGEGAAETLDFRTVTLTGTNLVIDGGSGNDTIYGSAGDNVLFGNLGDDSLDGGNGSDTYRVTGSQIEGWWTFSGYDTYADTGTAGTDRIVALSVDTDVDIGIASWQKTGIEVVDGTGAVGEVRLLGNGSANTFDFTGTSFVGTNIVIDGASGNDTIIGTAGADVIIGNYGDDSLNGGEGDDVYRVSGNDGRGFQNFDTYKDTGTKGVDRILAFDIGDVDIGVRGWQATGIEVIDGTGAAGLVRVYGSGSAETFDFSTTTIIGSNVVLFAGSGNDTLTGSAGDDRIIGGGDNDVLDGGNGSDTYIVTGNLFDGFQGYETYRDTGTAGTDTILVQGDGDVDVGITMMDAGNGIEVLDATVVGGTTRLLGTWGDDVMNFSAMTVRGDRVVIDAGNGADVVFGTAGADTIIGNSGNDSLAGGAGNDVYLVGRGSGYDVISDIDATAGNVDKVVYGNDVSYDQLWFQRLDGFVEVSIIGTGDKLYLMDWDVGVANQVEEFRTGDGYVLRNTQVNALITAMAAMTQPGWGQTTLTDAQRQTLAPVFAGTWTSGG